MVTHKTSVDVPATVHRTFALFSHFNDYPKYMAHVLEVTYYDDSHSHWVVDVEGRHEWDAVNEGWEADRRIGWRSTSGVQHFGTASFSPLDDDTTMLSIEVTYEPPAGVLGAAAERVAAGKTVERLLAEELQRFVQMVRETPPGALDPTASSYLYHRDSAAARGKTTKLQNATMPSDVSERVEESAEAIAPERVWERNSEVGIDHLGNEPPPPTER